MEYVEDIDQAMARHICDSSPDSGTKTGFHGVVRRLDGIETLLLAGFGRETRWVLHAQGSCTRKLILVRSFSMVPLLRNFYGESTSGTIAPCSRASVHERLLACPLCAT